MYQKLSHKLVSTKRSSRREQARKPQELPDADGIGIAGKFGADIARIPNEKPLMPIVVLYAKDAFGKAIGLAGHIAFGSVISSCRKL